MCIVDAALPGLQCPAHIYLQLISLLLAQHGSFQAYLVRTLTCMSIHLLAALQQLQGCTHAVAGGGRQQQTRCHGNPRYDSMTRNKYWP
jgi:hypothetical protein